MAVSVCAPWGVLGKQRMALLGTRWAAGVVLAKKRPHRSGASSIGSFSSFGRLLRMRRLSCEGEARNVGGDAP